VAEAEACSTSSGSIIIFCLVPLLSLLRSDISIIRVI